MMLLYNVIDVNTECMDQNIHHEYTKRTDDTPLCPRLQLIQVIPDEISRANHKGDEHCHNRQCIFSYSQSDSR